MPYPHQFEVWWNQNKNLFKAELARRARALSIEDNPSTKNKMLELEEALKYDVAKNYYANPITPASEQQRIFQNNLTESHAARLGRKYEALNQQTKNATNIIDIENELFDEPPLLPDTNTVPNIQHCEIQNYSFTKLYSELSNNTADDTCLALLKTYMTLANQAEEEKFPEGATLTIVWIEKDAIYTLNVGNNPVLIITFDDNDLKNDKSKELIYYHHLNAEVEKQNAQKLGAQIINNKIGNYQHTRAMGDFTDEGLPVPGVSMLPTISRFEYKNEKNENVYDLQKYHLIMFNYSIAQVYSPEGITKLARHARLMGTHNIAQLLVQGAAQRSVEDVSAVDIPIQPGLFAYIVSGHGVTNQARPNRVVEIVRQNLDAVFNANMKAIKPEVKAKVETTHKKLGRPPLPDYLKKTPPKTLKYEHRGRPPKSPGAAKHEQNVSEKSSSSKKENSVENLSDKSSLRDKKPKK